MQTIQIKQLESLSRSVSNFVDQAFTAFRLAIR